MKSRTVKSIVKDETGLSLLRHPFVVPVILKYPRNVASVNLIMSEILSEISYMGVKSLSPRMKFFA